MNKETEYTIKRANEVTAELSPIGGRLDVELFEVDVYPQFYAVNVELINGRKMRVPYRYTDDLLGVWSDIMTKIRIMKGLGD